MHSSDPRSWTIFRTAARRRAAALIAAGSLALIAIVTVALLSLSPGSGPSVADAATRTTSPAGPTPSPSPSTAPPSSPAPTPEPTPTSGPAPVEAAPPAAPAPEPAPAPAPEPAPAPPPAPPAPLGLTQFGWTDYSSSVQCPDLSGGHVVKSFSWTAVNATSVDLYVAMTDRDAQATDGYQLVASGLPTSGSTGVPITCSEATLYYTVKVVAVNGGHGGAAHMWGGVGLGAG